MTFRFSHSLPPPSLSLHTPPPFTHVGLIFLSYRVFCKYFFIIQQHLAELINLQERILFNEMYDESLVRGGSFILFMTYTYFKGF